MKIFSYEREKRESLEFIDSLVPGDLIIFNQNPVDCDRSLCYVQPITGEYRDILLVPGEILVFLGVFPKTTYAFYSDTLEIRLLRGSTKVRYGGTLKPFATLKD